MRRILVALLALSVIGVISLERPEAGEIVWEEVGEGNLDLRSILIDPKNPGTIYAGGDGTIIKTENGGKSWETILSIRGQSKVVNSMVFEIENYKIIYAATGNGLFYSSNKGQRWRRIFKGKNYLENQCTALEVLENTIYLGTKAGFFISKDRGRSWLRGPGELGKSHILAIAYHSGELNYIYVASVEGIFKVKRDLQSWEKVFLSSRREDNSNSLEQDYEGDDEDIKVSDIRYLTFNSRDPNLIYIATSRGVYRSKNRGVDWDLISNLGLLNRDIYFIVVSGRSDIFVATESGIFGYKNDRWQELSLRLIAGRVHSLSLDNEDNLYAAADKGLFKARTEDIDQESNIYPAYYQDQLEIRKLQEAAIRYAEVEPEKIREWRRQAAKKAWLPEVALSVDRNVTDLWHWEGGSTTRTDDDFLRKGNDALEWGLDLSWDLGELIWNDDQTSIDVRSRLMVQLRDDILDEVTKIYFERLRVMNEIDNLSITDKKRRFEKELRLRELTAYLDGLTGGYFSDEIAKGKEKLWNAG
ncbi:MAG: hypothetical protein KKC42_01940 [Candidatus Omnitrophica bacterium]|nr:hypothetical protein [Candidatus Omnitrophota bacterium]